MLAVVILFCSLMVSVQAFRVKVMNYLIDIHKQYTSFEIGDNEDKQNIKLADSYVPTYIPSGYEVSSVTSLST
ncbi:hypothetical protein SDC9_65441 [bioreactor metagenome]|uniref:Uncharacterized protein n=1 Tax=bioreactor metagenome TaxID=1076179 RepID=A0A644XXL0_9ZZZZ